AQMLVWARGGPTETVSFDGTIGGLIKAYQTDKDSTYHRMRYGTRRNHDRMLRRITDQHGDVELAEIGARMVMAWHKEWSADGKVAMGHGFIGQIRTLVGFGATMLEDRECERLAGILHRMRFQMAKPRSERMTA